ncbi:hypothetical protein V5O48_017748 [Marasmius crinis-equi]|uniref:Uncharacterized protein n=1 Tax=Marasmius crinis-equi TaxID=585013 RepID=A0ABR3EN45_9AGAR
MTSVQPPPYDTSGDVLAPEPNIIGILGNSEVRGLVKDRIDNLCEQTQNTRKTFEDIRILLNSLDSHESITKENKDIEPLRRGWDILRKRYDNGLSKSKADANMIKALCDDYKANILPLLSDENLDMKMRYIRFELQTYIKRSEDGRNAARENELASFDTITDHLFALTNLWKAVKNELDVIIIHLNNAVAQDITPRSSKKILGENLVGAIFQTLGDTLGKYIAQMDKLEEKK